MASLRMIPLIIDNESIQPPNAAVVKTFSQKTQTDYAQYVSASVADAIAAAESSHRAFISWSRSQPRYRREILRKTAALLRENAAELRQIQVEETNCPELWAATNVEWAALHLEEISGRITSVLTGEIPVVQTPGQQGFVYKRPVGPVLSIPPWNASVFLACRAIDQPLAAGCTVVLKASEQSPRTHHYLADLFHRAGVPAGVLNVIQVRREDAAAVSEALIAHPVIQKIEFIGSPGVGRRLGALAGQYLKPVLMELGGKAPALVLQDADLELAARGSVCGAYNHCGQTCFSTERIIVHAAVVDKFIPLLKEAAAKFPVPGFVSSTGMEHTLRLVKAAVDGGAKLLYGEIKVLEPGKMQPVILSGVTEDMEIADNEAFGPVLAVYVVQSDEEAVELANDTKFGLSAGIYSKDVGRALEIAGRIEVGQTHINFPMGTGTDEATLSVGLSKRSGWGRTNGSHGLDQFLDIRTVTVTDPVVFAKALAAPPEANGS